MVAIDTPSISSFCTSAAGSVTLSMPPFSIFSNSAPRQQIRLTASSRLNTPAMQAAVYSPRLWPIRASGLTPQDIHSFARLYSTANSAAKKFFGVCRMAAFSSARAASG